MPASRRAIPAQRPTASTIVQRPARSRERNGVSELSAFFVRDLGRCRARPVCRPRRVCGADASHATIARAPRTPHSRSRFLHIVVAVIRAPGASPTGDGKSYVARADQKTPIDALDDVVRRFRSVRPRHGVDRRRGPKFRWEHRRRPASSTRSSRGERRCSRSCCRTDRRLEIEKASTAHRPTSSRWHLSARRRPVPRTRRRRATICATSSIACPGVKERRSLGRPRTRSPRRASTSGKLRGAGRSAGCDGRRMR